MTLDDFLDITKLLAFTLVVIGGILGGLFSFALYMDSISCENKAVAMQRPHQWAITIGCIIQAKDGDWVPLGNYRKFGDEG